ncbi:hypothetical protein [Pseudoalteromonas sp. T1lg24]|uniref:hypothetical protein n=1 Tax=Pseudoalteromonas sp. T1lg24 TaxID=2077099 RepID=UPI000CF67500|nr:hypothetical protein [Pseudoalteromonas sp. T1lg24]
MKPICPECNNEITFLQSFRNINPWNYHCPNCRKRIDISKKWKNISLISAGLGFIYGLFTAANDIPMLQAFVPVLIIALFAQWFVWQRITFYKFNNANQQQDT